MQLSVGKFEQKNDTSLLSFKQGYVISFLFSLTNVSEALVEISIKGWVLSQSLIS